MIPKADIKNIGNVICPKCKRASLPKATLPRICPICGIKMFIVGKNRSTLRYNTL